jgi:hypothetical protein
VLAEVHNPYVVKLLYSFQVGRILHQTMQNPSVSDSSSSAISRRLVSWGCTVQISMQHPHLRRRTTSICTSSWSTSQAAMSW